MTQKYFLEIFPCSFRVLSFQVLMAGQVRRKLKGSFFSSSEPSVNSSGLTLPYPELTWQERYQHWVKTRAFLICFSPSGKLYNCRKVSKVDIWILAWQFFATLGTIYSYIASEPNSNLTQTGVSKVYLQILTCIFNGLSSHVHCHFLSTHFITQKAFDCFFIIYYIVVSFLVKLKTSCHKKLANNMPRKSFFHSISLYRCQE